MLHSGKTEVSLYKLLDSLHELDTLGGTVSLGDRHGVVVALGGRPIGLWGILGDTYVFREFGNYEPALTASTAEDVVEMTLALLYLCRHGWAERLGAIGTVIRAA